MNAYWWLVAMAMRIEVRDARMEWSGVIRSGSVPLNEVRTVRPFFRGSAQIARIEVADGHDVLIPATSEFWRFASVLTPDVRLPASMTARKRLDDWFDRHG